MQTPILSFKITLADLRLISIIDQLSIIFRKIFYLCRQFIKSSFSFFGSTESYADHKTILLVDDEIVFCNHVRDTLEKQGFKVFLAHTFESAKLHLANSEPVIVIIQQNLPDGVGTDFLANNRTVFERKQIILLTDDPSPVLKDNAMKLGVLQLLGKPVPLSTLSKVVYLAANFN